MIDPGNFYLLCIDVMGSSVPDVTGRLTKGLLEDRSVIYYSLAPKVYASSSPHGGSWCFETSKDGYLEEAQEPANHTSLSWNGLQIGNLLSVIVRE